jgi:signal transduction histidine kinase
LFEPFETAAESVGTGLGLAIAKAVVEAHHGKISIASVPNKGTTVDIRLPAPVEE